MKRIILPALFAFTTMSAHAAGEVQQPGQPPAPQAMPAKPAPAPAAPLDAATRNGTIDTLVAQLNAHYIFPDKAKQIEARLRQQQRDGKYDVISDSEQLARQLTEDIHGVAHDLHMTVRFSMAPVPADDAMPPPPATKAQWEQRVPAPMREIQRNMVKRSVEKVERISPRIGYMAVTGFLPAFLADERFAEAMNELADTDALIVDVRDNRGGGPDSVAMLISYFVDQRTRLTSIWDRDTGVTTEQWSQDKLGGKRYGGSKPVVILAGPETKSAGEDFAYTMQALKRATVIGAPTWGGAHPARPYRIGEHFFAVIPGRRSISPITHANWEGVGVIPDIASAPEKALDVARDLLQRRLQAKVN